jgi:hypothetical protein
MKTRCFLIPILCVVQLFSVTAQQTNPRPQLHGKVLIQTASAQDIKGFISVELASLTYTNSWGLADKSNQFFLEAKRAFSIADSLAEARVKRARSTLLKMGLLTSDNVSLSVDPTVGFALDIGSYADGQITNLSTGEHFAFQSFTNPVTRKPMYVARVGWSPDGKRLAIAGFCMNEEAYMLVEIDLATQRAIYFYKFEKAIESICYATDSENLAIILRTTRMPLAWLHQSFGGHGTTYYDLYLTIFDLSNKSFVVPEKLVIKDARHGARILWVDLK